MKKILLVAALFGIASAAFCKSKKVTPIDEPDSYDKPVAAEKKHSETAVYESDPYNAKKLKPKQDRTFGEKLFGLGKFQQIDPFSYYSKPPVGKFGLRKAALIYRPSTDIAGFYGYYDSSAYAVQFATRARHVLIDAVNMYLADFEAKRLNRDLKLQKTQDVYGSTQAYEEYGIAIAMLNDYAKPTVCFGYAFVKDNPYFQIYVKRSQNLAVDPKSEKGKIKGETIVKRYYFTKAQAKKLAQFLSDENVDFLYSETTYTEVGDGDYDEYDEYDAPKSGKTKTKKSKWEDKIIVEDEIPGEKAASAKKNEDSAEKTVENVSKSAEEEKIEANSAENEAKPAEQAQEEASDELSDEEELADGEEPEGEPEEADSQPQTE